MNEPYCWECKLCGKDSVFVPAEQIDFPEGFLLHPEKGVICKECNDAIGRTKTD